MPQTRNRSSSVGNFNRSADSAPPPAARSIEAPGNLQKALDTGLPAPVTDGAGVVRPPDTIKPAKNVNELQGQIGQLIAAYQSSEKRDPDVNDHAFWNAYVKLIDAYQENATNYEPSPWTDEPTDVKKVIS